MVAIRKEIDTEYTRDITCPYCGWTNCDSWEEGRGVNYDGGLGVLTCGECEKSFLASRNMKITYSTEKCPCQNGEEPHKFEPMVGVPKEYFKDKEECSQCGERRTKTNEVNVADGTTTNDGIPPNTKVSGILPTIL